VKEIFTELRKSPLTSTINYFNEEATCSSEPLLSYDYDPSLARDEDVVITVKTTLQLEKNEHQAELMRSANLGVFGREAARPYVFGIVAGFSLNHEHFDWTLAEAKWAFSAIEPYGIDASETKLALATAQSVQLIDMDTGKSTICGNAWLNQGHTVEFSPDGSKLLVGSSGFDAIFEFDTKTGKPIWEWFAWDHGFDKSKLGHFVVRSAARHKMLESLGKEVLLIDNPEMHKFGIPTRKKPAHLNSACYDSDARILITMFHQGAGYVIDRNTGDVREVISGLSNPHKLVRRKRGGFFISDTKKGKIIFLDGEFHREYEVTLVGMSGIARAPILSEFLQNTTELKEDLFACIDIHRSSLWIIDVKQRRYRRIKFPVEWSVHDVARIGRQHDERVTELARTRFGKIAAFRRQLKSIHHFSTDGRELSNLALPAPER
jgi:hypothetical protein